MRYRHNLVSGVPFFLLNFLLLGFYCIRVYWHFFFHSFFINAYLTRQRSVAEPTIHLGEYLMCGYNGEHKNRVAYGWVI